MFKKKVPGATTQKAEDEAHLQDSFVRVLRDMRGIDSERGVQRKRGKKSLLEWWICGICNEEDIDPYCICKICKEHIDSDALKCALPNVDELFLYINNYFEKMLWYFKSLQ